MSQEEFEAACAAAIAPYHDVQQDGPLLTCIRVGAKFCLDPDRWVTFPEYAAAIGYWPQHHNGSDYAQFTDWATETISDLKKHAKALWTARQPEPEEVSR